MGPSPAWVCFHFSVGIPFVHKHSLICCFCLSLDCWCLQAEFTLLVRKPIFARLSGSETASVFFQASCPKFLNSQESVGTFPSPFCGTWVFVLLSAVSLTLCHTHWERHRSTAPYTRSVCICVCVITFLQLRITMLDSIYQYVHLFNCICACLFFGFAWDSVNISFSMPFHDRCASFFWVSTSI